MRPSQAGWWGSAPVTKARFFVRSIRRSLWYSTYWLNAPALADASSTDSASTSTCARPSAGPGVTAMPTSAVIMISTPMRSLNSEMTSRANCAMLRPEGLSVVVCIAPGSDQLRPHSWLRYFQLTK